MEPKNSRHIQNEYPSKPNDMLTVEYLRQEVAEIFVKDLTIFLQKVKADEKRAICSVSNQSAVDITNFDGAGSYLTLYIEILNFVSDLEALNDSEKEAAKGILSDYKGLDLLNAKDILSRAQTTFDSLAGLVKEYEKSSKKPEISYYFGAPGLYLNGCFLSFYNNDKAAFAKNIELILSYKKIIIEKNSKYYFEILYGVAGYLYCLLVLQSKFTNPSNSDFKVDLRSAVRDVIEVILEGGLETWDKLHLQKPPKDFRLFYTFHEREYFGGAHGLFGILHILMKAYMLNKDFLEKETEALADSIKLSIRHSFNYLLQFQLPSGNFPTSEKRKTDEKLVQFCHGSPGIVPPLILASKFFSGEKLGEDCLKAAKLAGESIWNFGILKKGFGLCHGISGNAYSLLKLFKETNDSDWLFKGLCLLKVKNDKKYTDIIDNYEFNDRLVVGKSDYPYSLMLGLAGDIVVEMGAFSTVSLKFPGFDF